MPGRHHRNPHFSYGFRPGRSQHDALDALIVGISSRKVNFILDADIRSFFTEVSQEWVVRFLEHRIGDKRIIRLVQKWLRAGIVEDGVVTIEEKGTGQGSVISRCMEQETSDGQGVPRRLPARREVAIRRSSALLQKLRHSHQT
jgi:retron-type reverse transcriptase